MAFGLSNATQVFQRSIDMICRGFDFAFPYMGDTLIASYNRKEHLSNLGTVCGRRTQRGVKVHAQKLVTGADSIDFLSQVFIHKGHTPPIDYPKP